MDLKIDPFVKDKTLVFTVTSDGYKYYTWNLYKMLQQLKVPWKLCVLCLDRESNDFFLRIAQIPSRLFLMGGDRIVHKDPVRFGTSAFKRMNRMKLKAIEELSQRPELETLLFLDSDIAVFKDPVPYVKDCLTAHPLLFQCDEDLSGGPVCSAPSLCPNPCTGVIAMSLTPDARPTLKSLFKVESDPWKVALTDQDYVANRLKALGIAYSTLSRTDIPNGTFLSKNKYKEGDPYLLHFNYLIGTAKQRVMREKECWTLPEYV